MAGSNPPQSRSGLLEDLRRSAEAVAQACKRSNEMERAFLEKKVLNRDANEALDDFRRKRGQFGEYLLQCSDEIIAALSESRSTIPVTRETLKRWAEWTFNRHHVPTRPEDVDTMLREMQEHLK